MIYTVTFNPAIDYVVHTDGLKTGGVNRSSYEEIYIGGKGINVSAVLAQLGVQSIVLGFTAGFTGIAIERGVCSMGIEADFVRLRSGNSRINVKIKTDTETELNGQGPDIDENAVNELFAKLDRLGDGDTLILAGSIPNSLPDDIYERILERLSGKQIRTVVDATGGLLLNVLKYRPFLVKPNNFELEEMFGVTLTSDEEIAEYAAKLQKMGARNVLVSRSKDGAMLIDENGGVFKIGNAQGKLVNSVGCGDSMVGGFIAGYIQKKDYSHALRLGAVCGNATAFSEGLADKAEIDRVYDLLDISKN